MINNGKPIDAITTFYTTLLVGFTLWIENCIDYDEETDEPYFDEELYNYYMSYATPFLAMIDKILFDPTIGLSVKYDDLFLQYGTNVLTVGAMYDEEMEQLIDVEAFYNEYNMLPYEYYLLHGGMETYDVIKKLGTTRSLLITPFLDAIEGEPGATFPMKDENDNKSTLNWFEYNNKFLRGELKIMSVGLIYEYVPEDFQPIIQQYMMYTIYPEAILNQLLN